MINKTQIETIQLFCKNEISPYYDVQIEVTDHLVNDMEMAMQENPDTDFSILFEQRKKHWKAEWKEIIAAQSKSLLKNYTTKLNHAFIEYFTLPKIALTLLLVALVVYIDKSFKTESFIKASIHLPNIINAFFLYKKANIIYYNRRDKRFKLLTYNVIYWLNLVIFLPAILFYFTLSMLLIDGSISIHPSIYQTALYLFPLAIITLLAWKKVYINAHIDLRAKYQQAFA